MSSCFGQPSEVAVRLAVQVNKASVVQFFCLCSADEIFTVAPRFTFTNTSGNETQVTTKTFYTNRNTFLAYRVVPRVGTTGENDSDLRQQFTSALISYPNQIQVCTIQDGSAAPVDVRPFFVSTAENPRGTPVPNVPDGLTVVGEMHELHTQDPPVSGDALSYLPIGAKGLTTDNVHTMLTATPRALSALDTTPTSADAAVLVHFPQASFFTDHTYYLEGPAATGGGALTTGTNPHLASLTPALPNTTGAELDLTAIDAITPGPILANGALDSAPAGSYLQIAYNTGAGASYGGAVYVFTTLS